MNWTNERTYVQTVYRARVFCIDAVDHSTFLFKLVGLFVDGNVFSFGLMCIPLCVRHIFSLSEPCIEWKASARPTIFHGSIAIAPSLLTLISGSARLSSAWHARSLRYIVVAVVVVLWREGQRTLSLYYSYFRVSCSRAYLFGVLLLLLVVVLYSFSLRTVPYVLDVVSGVPLLLFSQSQNYGH